MTAPQTPIDSRTPPAIYYNLPIGSQSHEGKAIWGVLVALRKNAFVESKDVHPLSSIWAQMVELNNLGENWNGYEVSAPNTESIKEAKDWLTSLYREVAGGERIWLDPHVSANENGDVVFEWSRRGKKLVVYISPTESFYIQAWGPSIDTDMADGDISTPDARFHLWGWLMSEENNA